MYIYVHLMFKFSALGEGFKVAVVVFDRVFYLVVTSFHRGGGEILFMAIGISPFTIVLIEVILQAP